jgi:histidinol-phosphate aminotransferase
MKLSVPDFILSIQPYVPGKPLEELEREYGVQNSIKLASNENPLGPSPKAIEAIQREMANLNRYPDGSGYCLIQKLSRKLGVASNRIILGNGSDEIIGMLARALLQTGDEAIMPDPSFLMYDIMVRSVGAVPVRVPLKSMDIDLAAILEQVTSKTRMIFLTNPNNPTGRILSRKPFEKFLENLPAHVPVIMDEAYIEFATDSACVNGLDFMDAEPPVAVLRTFSKVYGLAGLRIGYGVMPAEMVSLLHRIRQPFNAGSLAQAGAMAALDDEPFLKRTIDLVHAELKYLYAELDRIGLTWFPTQANFFLIDVNRSADRVFEEMLRQGVIVRSMRSYGYPQYIRVNVGLHEENVRFVEALKTVLSSKG